MDKDLIFNQIHGENKHRQYREKSHKYSAEKRRIWEDIRHGFIYGSKKFVKKIKARYIAGDPDPAIPQQKSLLKSTDPLQFLVEASQVLQCDLDRITNCARISQSDKINRDVLLYWLWQEGKYTNLQIGDLFGLTHSSVSRRVTIIRKKMALEQNFQRQVDTLKSQIKP